MENASQALIIAGAILLAILIIAIGMFVYNGAQSTISDSMASMSDQEVKAFNSKFLNYEGKASGSQVKNLIGDLISNSSTYAEEPNKIVALRFDKVKGNNTADTALNKAMYRPDSGTTDTYVTELGKIRNAVENKHTYWVELVYNSGGLIDTINVSYDPSDPKNAGNVLSKNSK